MTKNLPDIDALESQEWLQALDSVIEFQGQDYAEQLLNKLLAHAESKQLSAIGKLTTPYKNTIAPDMEDKIPSEYNEVSEEIRSLIRWNAVAMVLRAGKKASELGGHIATFASAATLYDIGFSYFFHARSKDHPGDLVYYQGHASPGIYARAFLEGRLSEEQLENFRQEVNGNGLSSYPHTWLMPDFWQFATVSMGLGPLQAIYQARFLKYLANRNLIDNKDRKVWMFCGDGEMDEPESIGALPIAAREKLDNLIFVINCNLQRLDGPVRGNSKVIQELEGVFSGAGWRVIKVIWGSGWDRLLAKDQSGLLLKRMEECVDGEYQNFKAKDGAFVREHFFGKYPELLELVSDMSDDEIWALARGGHDPQKVFAGFSAAVKTKNQPVVVITKTVKGYGMGAAGEGLNITHQQKKMSTEQLQQFCERFNIPIPKNKIAEIPFYKPPANSPGMKFLKTRRKALGGHLPARQHESKKLTVPDIAAFKSLLADSGDRELSTTMAFVRILSLLLRDQHLKQHIVPIVPDESRTFGMEGLFRQIGIYSPVGQLYEPVDKEQVMYYREAKDGQLLEEGITEAGGFASWIAAGTSYSTSGLPMIPFFIFYSMFGFQRIGDLAWAAGDMRTRGFLLGATAGRTTLAGEGLQHDDGQSQIQASIIPNCVTYDPTYQYELAVIIQHGLQRMYFDQEDVYYYITVMNENYFHPTMPEGCEEGIIKGMYLLHNNAKQSKKTVQLMGSGAILREVEAACELLKEYGVAANVWSVTSFNELRRDMLATQRHNLLNPGAKAKQSYIQQCLQGQSGPVIAATDYMKIYADQIRAHIDNPFYVLGTDGFSRSDTRVKLREHFEVNANFIAYTALKALADQGVLSMNDVKSAQKKLAIDPKRKDPATA